MPLSRITTNFELGSQKENFIESYHKVMQNCLGIPEYDRMIVLEDSGVEFITPPDWKGKALLVEISLFAGRTLETKKCLYAELAVWAEDFGIDRKQTRFVLHEIKSENWGIRGGQAASELALGFKVDV